MVADVDALETAEDENLQKTNGDVESQKKNHSKYEKYHDDEFLV